jgi:hypothetical protein
MGAAEGGSETAPYLNVTMQPTGCVLSGRKIRDDANKPEFQNADGELVGAK